MSSPTRAGPAEPALHKVIETHVSLLSFDGDIVRKRKKAVRFPFIDLTSPELRLAACRQEVALNRRLAPDVYLGLEESRDRDGQLTDAVVVMRRLPEDLQLSTLIEHGHDVADELVRVAHVLAAFHSTTRRGTEIDSVATPSGLRARWEADLDEWEPLVQRVLGDQTLDRERALARRYVEGRGELLRQRVTGGHIVDGHGDLRADSIFCLADRPRIIDCLEFDARLRWGDELADVAFLAMDLEARARPDLGNHFVRAYGRFAGWIAPPSLLHFYIAHRALVRSKVACWRVLQGDSAAGSSAHLHLDQCRGHLEAARPLLIVIGGGPRTGKSTIARSLADATACLHLRSDEVRRDFAAAPRAVRVAHDRFNRGMYTPAVTARTYAMLASRTRTLMRAGYSVILDATFPSASSRAMAGRLARECHADLVEIECHAPVSVVEQRSKELNRLDDLSEATPELATALGSRRAPWPTALSLDTTRPEAALLAQCLSIVGGTPVST
jgi:uncharacterized protein